MREVDSPQAKTEGENTTPQSRYLRDRSPDKGSFEPVFSFIAV